MKTNASFKLSKQSKIHCAHILDPHRRGAIRRSFIEAEVMRSIQPKLPKTVKTQQEQS